MTTNRGREAELASLKAKEASLAAQHAALERRLAKISQDLATARRKRCHGILLSIFMSLHSAQLLEVEGRYWQIDRVPVRVEVVLSHTPALWGTFWCDKASHCANLVAASQQLKEYLARSGPDQDLELYFDFSETNLQPEPVATRYRYRVLASELLALTNMTIIAKRLNPEGILILISKGDILPVGPQVGTPHRMRWDIVLFSRQIHCGEGWMGGSGSAKVPQARWRGPEVLPSPIQTLTHLLLEGGPSIAPPDDDRAQAYKLQIDWSVLLSSEILRLPHLESLSLHESILNPHTFPHDGKDIQRLKNDVLKDLFIEALALKHLRIGGLFRGRFPHGSSTSDGDFLLFLLRFIAAPVLESLTEKKGWGGEPAPIYAVQDRFESLKTLVLSDVFVGSSALRRAPFAHLMRRTSTAQTITVSQRWPDNGPIDLSVEFAQNVIFERPAGRVRFTLSAYTPSPGQSSGKGRVVGTPGVVLSGLSLWAKSCRDSGPLGGRGTRFNTLRSEQFNPFEVDIS
ncbi:hypothetical protein FA13DRAFT_1746385 [Coprinellus micaceus]|uniref:Uncharacterized protein n=1 Tax=Coprinellus micaceus TaxID=71717 RepID=A0A4Y7SA96_COPMI|nr:hypothetical protein FA13DRAFT_1746385 [Coprinellus micaceus]